jgi:hypothetical protein
VFVIPSRETEARWSKLRRVSTALSLQVNCDGERLTYFANQTALCLLKIAPVIVWREASSAVRITAPVLPSSVQRPARVSVLYESQLETMKLED